MTKFRMTPEEHARAVMEALEKTHKKNMESKEAAIKFLKEIGVIEEDKNEVETETNINS